MIIKLKMSPYYKITNWKVFFYYHAKTCNDHDY